MAIESKCGPVHAGDPPADPPGIDRGGDGEDGCRTASPSHTTAARLGARYARRARLGDNPNKAPDRPDDGTVTSHDYARQSRQCRREQAGDNGDGAEPIHLDFHHPLEDWLGRRPVRWLLDWLSRSRPGGGTLIEEIIASYANPDAPGAHRFRYWPFHRLIDWLKGSTPRQVVRERIGQHSSTVRGLVATARSVAEFGLTRPQRFAAPLFVVWNFTNQCNLRCRHCYQDSTPHRLPQELTLAEKLGLVDQAASAYVAMIAFAGGEPTLSPHLPDCLRRCQRYGIHTSVATNGTTMTERRAAELADAGVKYVEISLDSVHPERHDAFRGQPGMWRRSVAGMRAVVAQEGLRLGVAMCVHRGNFHEVEDMLRFAVDIGAGCFAHFNFIPVGRGREMADDDLTPRQRERLLRTLNAWMQSGRIGVISTAPQLGRVCLACAPFTGRTAVSHAGSGAGWKARVVGRYLGGCGAGRTYACVEPNGDVTPCVYMPHRVLGNVRTRRLVDVFRDNEFRDLLCDRDRRTGHCEVCEFKLYCGGCRARADAYYGQLNAGDPGCLFNEKHWDRLVAAGAESAFEDLGPLTENPSVS